VGRRACQLKVARRKSETQKAQEACLIKEIPKREELPTAEHNRLRNLMPWTSQDGSPGAFVFISIRHVQRVSFLFPFMKTAQPREFMSER
jgi:hypothetical protein